MEKKTKDVTPNGLDEFTAWIDSFCDTNHIPGCVYKDEYNDILEMEYEDLLSLTADECFAKAIMLMNYSTYLQRRMSVLKSQLNWCKEIMEYQLSKHWSQYDKSFPWEVKRKAIIKDNSYMLLVQKWIIQLESSVTMIEDSYHDVKKRVSLFESLGKHRRYE